MLSDASPWALRLAMAAWPTSSLGGLRTYADNEALLAAPRPPRNLHRDAQHALELGKHVIVEKPLRHQRRRA